MGSACTACCDPVQKKDAECDLSSRRIPHKQPMALPTPAEAEIRRHPSRDYAKEENLPGDSKQESSVRQNFNPQAVLQLNLKKSSSQNAGALSLSPSRAQYDGSNPELLKGKGTLGADLSNIKSAVQNSKLSDPPFVSNLKLGISNPMESPINNRLVYDKHPDPDGRPEDPENSSDLRSSVTNNALELPGPIGTDQNNYIVVMRADQTKNVPADRNYRKSPSDCKSIEKGLDEVQTPQGGNWIYLVGPGAHLMPSRSAITATEDGGTLLPNNRPRDPQGYLFSQETAHNKLDNSILKSRVDLANYPSGRTIDMAEEGKMKDTLKIMSYDQLTDMKVFTEKKYQKTLVHL